mgnify:CR=1 FL=1
MKNRQLDKLDESILRLVANNARIPFLEVARECGVSGAAIHQRIQRLTTLGVLKGSEFVVDPESVGYETCAYMGLFLKHPEDFQKVYEGLLQIPEIVECHYTTGPYSMLVKLYARDNEQLMDLLNNKIQSIQGVDSTETLISLDQSIKKEIPISFG